MDKFGVKEIYPTKDDGREWFINMQNPKKDPLFSITSNNPIIRQNNDRSLFINDSNIRMNVITPPGETQWKNIEMTGYVKAIPTINEITSFVSNNVNTNNNNEESKTIVDISWQERGGSQNSKTPA